MTFNINHQEKQLIYIGGPFDGYVIPGLDLGEEFDILGGAEVYRRDESNPQGKDSIVYRYDEVASRVLEMSHKSSANAPRNEAGAWDITPEQPDEDDGRERVRVQVVLNEKHNLWELHDPDGEVVATCDKDQIKSAQDAQRWLGNVLSGGQQ